MSEFNISKQAFYNGQPDDNVKVRVMDFVLQKNHNIKKINLIAKYKFNYKLTFISMLTAFFAIGGFSRYQYINQSFDKEITQTQTAINELVAMNDTDIL